MDISQLKIGTKLELELTDEDDRKRKSPLVSEFEWLEGNETLVIAAPIYESVVYPIHIGLNINVYFVVKSGNEYVLYSFQAKTISREMKDNLALLRIVATSPIQHVQRREYYRLGCSLPVKFRVVDSMNEAINENIQYRNTIACNLSGGGICLLLEDSLEIGKMVECEIFTEENKLIRFFGKVIRREKHEFEDKFKFEAGIVYIKINNNDREAVVKYIFNEQRKLRKRGMI